MINRRFLIVPPALLGRGHAENAWEKQAVRFLCLLLDMANIRVQRFLAPNRIMQLSQAYTTMCEPPDRG
jgi:hypothetical protein